MRNFSCERPSAAVPRDLPLDGLSLADLAQLGEGDFTQERVMMMNEKLMGVLRHILTAVGAVVVYMGWTDDATWVTVMGSLMTMIPFMWSWVSK
jgi:hypothetical protein